MRSDCPEHETADEHLATQILIDRNGYLRKQQFGICEDMKLGADIMSLLRD